MRDAALPRERARSQGVTQVVATAGHVDHGKSTLVRALTGMEPDRWEQEQRRGLTLDLGFAWTRLPGGETVAFVDVPGHQRFVSTMLAGVGPVPAVLFMVAADEGWMPQSQEHLDALAALGTEHGLLVVTRRDLMEPELALEEAREHLDGTSLAGIPAVCVSAATGEGLDELRAELARLVSRLPQPDPDQDVRMWLDRAFTIRGAGTVVTGTLAHGRLRVGDELLLLPGDHRVTIRGLHSMDTPISEAIGVARIAVNLRGLDRATAGRGSALLTPERWLTVGTADVRLRPVHPDSRLPVRLTMHIGSAAVPVRVRPLGSGDAARLTLATPLPLRIGDQALLRDPGEHRIVAGLTVLDVLPPPLTRRGDAARRAKVVQTMPEVADPDAEITRRGLVRTRELAAMGAPEPAGPHVLRRGDWLVHRQLAGHWATRLADAVTKHDAADPLAPGLSPSAAGRVLDLPDIDLVELAVAAAPDGALVLHEGRVRRADTLDEGLHPALRQALDALRAELAEAPFQAPESHRLTELGLGSKELAALVNAGELDRVGPGIYLLPGAEQAAVDVLAALSEPEFTLSTARQALGTTRRVAVPLLELLARRGRTARTADGGHRLLR
jgi:selenocysteine-specific elongation factor